MNITNNKFIKNIAYREGGAIKWNQKMPIIDNTNIFQSNQAVYGSNIASYPIRNRIKIIRENETEILHSSKEEIKLDNIASGSEIDFSILVEVVDLYGNIVTTADK